MFASIIAGAGRCTCRWFIRWGTRRPISAKRGRSSAGSSRRSISSPSTCRTATRHTFGRTLRRRPRHGSTGTCTRSRSSAPFRCRFSTTTTGAWCRGLSATGRAAGRGCSVDFSRTTSSGTGTGAPARATTRGRWRVWWAGRGATSWFRCRALQTSRRSTSTWNSAAASASATFFAGIARASASASNATSRRWPRCRRRRSMPVIKPPVR